MTSNDARTLARILENHLELSIDGEVAAWVSKLRGLAERMDMATTDAAHEALFQYEAAAPAASHEARLAMKGAVDQEMREASARIQIAVEKIMEGE